MRYFFLLLLSVCSPCGESCESGSPESAITLSINQSHFTRRCLCVHFIYFFPPVNSTTAVYRSVYFPLGGLSHVGHWLEYSKWVTEHLLGQPRAFFFFLVLQLKRCRTIMRRVLRMTHVSGHVRQSLKLLFINYKSQKSLCFRCFFCLFFFLNKEKRLFSRIIKHG